MSLKMRLSIRLYRSLLNVSNSIFHGVAVSNASAPFSQNKFNSTGLYPDIIDVPGADDKQGNPDVPRKFQNRI